MFILFQSVCSVSIFLKFCFGWYQYLRNVVYLRNLEKIFHGLVFIFIPNETTMNQLLSE